MALPEPVQTAQGHIFVSYAHDDQERILPEVGWLKSQGYAVWYDIEIRPGTAWADELAAAIDKSNSVLFFVSERSISSTHCLNEIAYALEAGKSVLAVYLEPVELSGGLRLSMSRTQALLHWQLKQTEFRAQIREAIEHLQDAAEDRGFKSMQGHGVARTVRKIWQVPLSQNLHFVGRDQQIGEIASVFEQSQKPMVLALTGLGGVGKSQLALEYLYRHKRDVPVVAWIRAESAATAETDFVALAKSLNLAEADDADIRRVIAAVHDWLESNEHWFLVLDNVTNPQALRKCLPRVLSGNVLLTTRHQGWGTHARVKTVMPFGDDEARAFVVNRTGDPDTDSASKLVAMLGGLPLALEEAAAYMETTGRSTASYLELFQSFFRDHLLARSRPTEDYPATLRTTWEMSFRQLEESDPGAASLLNLLAFLAPDDIPKSLLLKQEAAESPNVPAELLIDEYLAALLRYSLVKVDDDAVSVHRLVQMVTRDRLSAEQRNDYATAALQVVELKFPISGAVGDMLPDCGRLLPHALASLEHTEKIEEAQLCAARLLARTGTYLCARGSTVRGISQLKRTVETLKNSDDCSAEYAHACELLGRACYQCGKLSEARSLIEKAIDIFDRAGDPSGTNFALCLTVLSWICWTDGDGPAARKAAERCIALVGSQSSKPDPRLLGGQAILSRVLLEEGRMSEAVETAESCVSLIEALGGARHPLMGGTFIHLAQVLLDAGMPLRARSWAQEALSLVGPAYGEHHPLVSSTRCIMGQILSQLGENESAYKEYQAAIESVRHSDSSVPQVSVIGGALLIRMLISLDRAEEAAELLEEAKRLASSKVCGDAALARCHALLAEAALELLNGNGEQSAQASGKADAIICERYSEKHLYRVPALIARGKALMEAGAKDEAADTIDAALEILQDNDLHYHPQGADAFIALAEIADLCGNSDEALQHRSEALRILKRATGPSSRATTALESRLASR